MEKVIDVNGVSHLISENEINRGILVDRLMNYAEKEQDTEERALLQELSKWIEQVSFA